jgi:hypothetical protein
VTHGDRAVLALGSGRQDDGVMTRLSLAVTALVLLVAG